MKHLWIFALGALAAGPGWAVTCQNNIPPSNPDTAYAVHGDGTLTDTRTGLMWKVCAEGQIWSAGSCTGTASAHTWSGALALAADADYAGHGDWRLPNLKELRSLVEECRRNPTINDSIFPQASSSYFWSGSPYAGFSSLAWVVSFDYGFAYNVSRGDNNSVRLVRGGQGFAAFAAGSGTCGSAAGVATGTAPTANLCTTGTASAVSGNGMWSWSCAGSGTGATTASCTAPLEAVNGACGSADGVATGTVPTASLCATGTASAVSGNGMWSWSCAGSGTGATTASCTAPLAAAVVVHGSCGAADGLAVTVAPAADLCAAGTASAVSGNGPWSWNCTGSGTGATTASCTAPLAAAIVVNGSCGAADGLAVTVAPAADLCAAGTASAVSGNGPWSWNCTGSGTGATTASCTAPLAAAVVVNGSCGAADGLAVTAAPAAELCAAGTASAVSGNGPWNWSCAGEGAGATNAACTAPQATPIPTLQEWTLIVLALLLLAGSAGSLHTGTRRG